MSEAKLIAHGARCVWWDSLEKAGQLTNGLPCCPHCQSVLFQQPEEHWILGVKKHDDRAPGYQAFIEWLRGKCYPNWGAAKLAYDREQKIIDTEDTQPSR